MDNYRIQDDELYYHKKGSEDWKKGSNSEREGKNYRSMPFRNWRYGKSRSAIN